MLFAALASAQMEYYGWELVVLLNVGGLEGSLPISTVLFEVLVELVAKLQVLMVQCNGVSKDLS